MLHNYSIEKRAVPMRFISALVHTMELHGYTAAQVLANTDISAVDLVESDQRVSYRQRIQQLNNVIELMGHRPFWLDTEVEVSISDYGLLGYAMMSSATLEQAIQIAVKYHRMAGLMYDLGFVVEGKDAVLRLEHLLTTGDTTAYTVEELFRSITPLISLLLGRQFVPSRINLNYSSNVDSARYQQIFGCVTSLNEKYCEYRFDAALLPEKLAEADSDVAKSCEEACRQLLLQMDIEEDLISKICHLLLSRPGEFPKLDVVASRLSIGTRTLRRRLKGLGTCYQQILDDVKKQLANEYLQTTNLSVQEISDLLGYSEVTNFRRAYVKWAGMSPYQYRKQFESLPHFSG